MENSYLTVSIDSTEISGIFTMKIYSKTWKIISIILVVTGLILLIHGLMSAIFGGNNEIPFHTIIGFLMILIFIRKAIIKPVIKFQGMRFNNNSIELGKLKIKPVAHQTDKSEERDLLGPKPGIITKGEWNYKSVKDLENSNFSFVFKQMKKPNKTVFYLEEITIASNENKIYTLISKSQGGFNHDTIIMRNGKYKFIGALRVQIKNPVIALQRIQELITLINIPVKCSIKLLTATGDPVNYAYGIVGVAINSYIKGKNRLALLNEFNSGMPFNEEFSSQFFKFIDENNWTLFIGDQEIQKNNT
jgi:hypothetical protein